MPTKFQITQRPASRQAGVRASLAESGTLTHLRLRLNLHVRWIWELVDADNHVVNVSAQDFSTRRECELDARRHGFRLEVKSAANLTKLRQKAGLSQSEFWERVGVTQSGGSRYEKGQLVRKPLRMLLTMAYGSARERERVVQQLAKSEHVPDKGNG
jgi:DNA-binding transcriptional regulator YiaG